MRYLFISYHPDKNLKDTQWYDDLNQVRIERGITCSKEVIERTRVALYSSPDGSGCFLLDFKSGQIDDIDTTHSKSLMKLITQVRRELVFKELGI